MGRAAAESGATTSTLTSDNPRSEDPRQILDQIDEGVASVAGGRRAVPADRRPSRGDRDRHRGRAQPGDAVVIAGKGHETTQTLGDRVVPFDDRQVASEALESLGWRGRRRGAGA